MARMIMLVSRLLPVALVSGLAAAGPPSAGEIQVRLHSETGGPIFSWRAERGGKEYFDIYRSLRPEVQPHRKNLLTTKVVADYHFDHHTFAGETYYYRVAKVKEDGSVALLSGEVSIGSKKNCYSVEGKFAVLLRATATYNIYRVKRGPDDAGLVLGEHAQVKDQWLRSGRGTGWHAAARASEPHPALTVTLPKKEKIGRVRIKPLLPDPNEISDARVVELAAFHDWHLFATVGSPDEEV